MAHAPQDPAVQRAYAELIRQTKAQYDALVANGYRFTFFDDSSDPYAGNPWNAMRDLRANQTMAVYGTYAGYGTEGITAGIDDNPLMAEIPGLFWPDQSGQPRPVTANDLFRAVHDAFGHGIEGAGFRARGEENAWQAHVRLFYGDAVAALTSETRGQNSWLNYGPYGETNRTAGIEDTVFAEQKTGLLPSWAWTENVVPPAEDGIELFQMAGPKAETSDLGALERAQQQEAEGKPAADVWRDTGWARGADGLWRFEISDDKAKVKPRLQRELENAPAEGTTHGYGAGARLGQVLTHTRLFKAYPGLKSLPIEVRERLPQNAFAGYLPGRRIELSAERLGLLAPETQLKVLLHEVQHAVQFEEGFAPGGGFLDADTYRRSAGEVEANNAMDRSAMSPAERREWLPVFTERVPREEQIVVRAPAARSFVGAERLSSPAFKDWFKQSKVVDKDGDPLVVYHGTERGGFTVFDTGGSGKTAGAGAFFTNDLRTARTYYSGRDDEISPLSVDDVLQNPEIYGFEVEPVDEAYGGGWEAINPDGESYQTDDRQEALEGSVVEWVEAQNDRAADQTGYYRAYLSMQDPLEIDAKMQPWNAILTQPVYVVRNADGEFVDVVDYDYGTDPEYLANTYGDGVYAVETEADVLAEEDLFRYVPDALFETTDDIARMARDMEADGAIIRNVFDGGPFGSGGELSDVYIAFEPAQIKSIHNRGQWNSRDPDIFSQKNRGRIVLPRAAGQAPVIELFEGSDLSTLLHESGHYFLYTMEQMVANGDAPDSVVEDMNKLRNWWAGNAEQIASEQEIEVAEVKRYIETGGAGDTAIDAAVYRGMQELFARSYERYLMEGKAPSKGLQRLFDTFQSWLINIYRRGLSQLRAPLDDEVRGVFDRLLAVDEEIEAAKAATPSPQLIAASAEALGVDPATYQKIVLMNEEAEDEARRQLLAEVMAPLREQRTQEIRERKAQIREEVRAEVEQQPEYRIVEWLGNGRWVGPEPESVEAGLSLDPDSMRLDRGMLVEDYGAEVLRQLPRGRRAVYAEDTAISADELAGWFGYGSGDAMIKALRDAPAKEAVITRRTAQRLREELPADPLADGSIAERARASLQNDNRGRVLEAELRALSKGAGGSRKATAMSVIREVARSQIRNLPVRDATAVNRYRQAAERAGDRAQRALARGERDAAFAAKRQQMMQHALFMEARKAEEMVAKGERLVQRLRKKSSRENIDGVYLQAIDEILDRYDFRRSTSRTQEERRGALLRYVQEMQDAGRENELAIPEHVLEQAQRRPYRTLSVTELQGVFDALSNIMHTGRRKKQLIDAQRQRDLDALVDELLSVGAENTTAKARKRTGETKLDRWVQSGKEILDLVLNADTLLRRFDGWTRGAWYDAIKAPVDEAENSAIKMRKEAAEQMEKIYAMYSRRERQRMSVAKSTPELATPADRDANFSRWDLISMALNMGNRDNLARLMDTDSGYGFGRGQIEYVKNQLTDRDWDFVEAVWAHIGSYWPQIEARERRQTGVAPPRVEPLAIELESGRKLAGGYYPIKYDPRLRTKTEADEIAETLQNMKAGQYGKAQTRNGHTKARSGGSGGRVLQLGMAPYHQHIAQVTHDLAFSEPVANSWRILNDPRVVEFFEQTGNKQDRSSLEMWLQDVATGPMVAGGVAGRVAVRLKNTFTLSKLAFNLSTVLVQVTGLSQSMVVVGKVDFMRGVADYMGNSALWVREVSASSSFMQERRTTFHRDIYDLMGDTAQTPTQGAFADFQQGLGRVGFAMMTYLQFYAVDMPTWVAAYKKAMRAGEGEGRARDIADRAVARAQASGLMADRSAIERGTISRDTRMNGFVRLFTALGSYMFAKGNVAHERVAQMRRGVTGVNFSSARAIGSASVDLVLLFTLEAVLYHLIKGTLPDDEDEAEDPLAMEKFLASETALAIMGTMPVARDAASAMKGFDGGGAYGSILSELSAPVYQGSDGEVDLAFVKSASSAIGTLTGLPSGQANRVIDAWWRQAEGQDVAPIEYIMGRR